MRRIAALSFACLAALAGSAAMATTPANRAVSARHLLEACMSKKMTASRSVSYYDAERECKLKSGSESATLASTVGAKLGAGSAR